MNKISLVVLVAVASMAVASAQAQMPGNPEDNSQMTVAPAQSFENQENREQSRPLFTFGGIEAHVWAPLEAPYNSKMNRSRAEDPLWSQGD